MKTYILLFIIFIYSTGNILAQELAEEDIPQMNTNVVVEQDIAPVITSTKESQKKDRQKILLEVKVFQIILSDEHPKGVDWEASVSNYHSLSFFGQLDTLHGRDRNQLSFGNLTEQDYELLIEALDTVGIVNPLSNSRVETRPDGKAKVYVGLTEPYVITMTTNLPEDNNHKDDDFSMIDRGVEFYFTPSIDFDGKIAVNIQPDEHLFKKGDAQVKELEIRAQDGETIVIGGLVKNEKVERLRKIPLLGDLPILGFAFRNPNQTVQAIEYVLFLTPKVVTQ